MARQNGSPLKNPSLSLSQTKANKLSHQPIQQTECLTLQPDDRQALSHYQRDINHYPSACPSPRDIIRISCSEVNATEFTTEIDPEH